MKVKLGEVINIYDSLRKPVAKHKRVKGIYPYYGANGIQDYVDKYIFDGLYILVGEDGSVINKDNSPVVNIASGKFWVNNHAHIIQPKNNTLNLMFLYYALKKVDIYNLLTKSIPPKLNQESLKNIIISIPPVQTQKEIVAVLDKVTSLISMRKEQLEKLDILVKSKFIEMFGDPVLNPKGWEKKKLGEVCNVVVGGDVPLDNFSKEKNEDYNIPIYSNGLAENMLYGYTNNARIQQPCVTVSARGTIGYCFPHFKPFYPIVRLLCVIPSNNFSILFLCHQINSINIKSSGSGVAQLTSPMIKSCALIIPPLDLQNQFAEFVEQVEKNKENIKSSLNQLETLYNALMQEYFG